MSDGPTPLTEEEKQLLDAAKKHEEEIATRAAEARGEATELTPELFLDLHEMLCEPIPEGFIKYVPRLEKGKPYESTGIKSVQVQIDRMNNVLTPLWWWAEREYTDGGKVCRVDIYVGNRNKATDVSEAILEAVAGGGTLNLPSAKEQVLAHVTSYGGVDRGSSTGNVYKGSFTNAAKIGFAQLGLGHEIYLGAVDLELDVNPEASDEPEAAGAGEPIGTAAAKELVDRAWKVKPAKDNLRRAATYAAGRDVGEIGTKKAATEALASLTFPQSEKLDEWIAKKEKG
jgi:hypothetical protein